MGSFGNGAKFIDASRYTTQIDLILNTDSSGIKYQILVCKFQRVNKVNTLATSAANEIVEFTQN